MRFFTFKLTIGRKLIGGFLLVALLMLTVTGLSYFSLRSMKGSFDELVNKRVQMLSHAERIQAAGLQQNDYMREYFLNQTPASVQRMQTSNTRIIELIDETLPLLDKEEEKASYGKLKEMAQDYKARVDSILLLDHEKALREANFSLFPLATQIVVLAEGMAEEQLKLMTAEQIRVEEAAKLDQTLNLAVSLFVVAASIAIGILCSMLISRPILRITEVAKQVAGGNLTIRSIGVRTKDEIRDLADAFEEMIRQLRSIISKVEEGADHMVASSTMLSASAEQTSLATAQITEASQEVAVGAERQVQGSQDSARAMEEMTAGIGRIAESSSAVFEMSVTARSQADEGNQAAQEAVRQMNIIHEVSGKASESVRKLMEHSEKIGSIIGVITEIASQTSLLALNASIEAARAGEQGRGFMVVATEVKKLAIQSEEAAGQIAKLIREVQQDTKTAVNGMNEGMLQTREGLEVVKTAGQAFTRILEAIQHVSAQIEEVSATSEEISAGSQEVAASVEETARIARQSAEKVHTVAATSQEQLASMQEIASSSATLSNMAAELQHAVSRFKL